METTNPILESSMEPGKQKTLLANHVVDFVSMYRSFQDIKPYKQLSMEQVGEVVAGFRSFVLKFEEIIEPKKW